MIASNVIWSNRNFTILKHYKLSSLILTSDTALNLIVIVSFYFEFHIEWKTQKGSNSAGLYLILVNS